MTPSNSWSAERGGEFTMQQVYGFGPFVLDARSCRLSKDGQDIHVTAKAYSTLLMLVERAGSLVTKDELLASVWPEGFIEPANLTQTIYILRKTLGDVHGKLIETVPGRGYRFNEPVRALSGEAQSLLVKTRTLLSLRRQAVWAFPMALIMFALLSVHSSSLPSRHIVNPLAQRDYILGRHYWSERTPAGLSQGLRYFKAAIALDPGYAQAYSGLADSYAEIGIYEQMGAKKHDSFMQARSIARRALSIDPNSAEAHASLAFAEESLGRRYFPDAGREYERSIQLDDRYASARHWYSWYLFDTGRRAAGLEQMRQARNLDPLSPVINFAFGYQLFFARQFEASANEWHETIALEPDSSQSYLGAGLADEQLGRHTVAQRELRRALALAPTDPEIMAALAYEYAQASQRPEADRLWSMMAKMRHVPPIDVALVKEGLGEHAQAMAWLNRARKLYDSDEMQIALDPRFDRLRQATMARRAQVKNG